MKRKEAIKQIQEGKIQVFNDLLPSTKEIKKFLKEAFPEDYFLQNEPNTNLLDSTYFFKDSGKNGACSYHKIEDLPIINLSTITKRKKTKLSQLEKQFSDLAKDVIELRQTRAKDIEVDVEEIQQEAIKEEEIDWSVQELFIYERGTYIVCSNGKSNLEENTFEGKVIYSTWMHQDINFFSKNWSKSAFKPFKGELTIK